METEMIWDDFSKPPQNMGLKVEERIFWVNRDQLTDLSPVFQAMLCGEFKEAKDKIITLEVSYF